MGILQRTYLLGYPFWKPKEKSRAGNSVESGNLPYENEMELGGNMAEETIQRNVNDAPDSLEIGTPAKGGAIKVYGNANDLEGFKKKIDSMIELRKYAQKVIGE